MDLSVHGDFKQLMVDSLQDCALVVLDTDGKVLSWNAGAQGLLGYEEAEAVGLSFARIVPPETLDPAGAPPSLALARRKGRHEEICQRMRSDGRDLVVREVVIPLRDRQHNLVAFGLMMQPIEGAPGAGGSAVQRPIVISTRKACKVLVADDDILTPPYSSELIAAHIPHAELIRLPRGGHAVSRAEPEIFNETVLGFLGKHAFHKEVANERA